MEDKDMQLDSKEEDARNKELSKLPENQEEKVSLGKEIFSWVLDFIIIVALSLFIVTYVGQRTVVDGSSMYNTLENGDNLIVDKVSYRFSDIERFDIVVFRFQGKRNVHYIKRVIGLPGETVQIIGNDIYINGEILEENYRYEENMNWAGIAEEPITLGEDEYFVLGDNRNESADSRDSSVGKVPAKWIEGKAFIRIFPFSAFGFIE